MSEQDGMLERARAFCDFNKIHNGSVLNLSSAFRAVRREALEEAFGVIDPHVIHGDGFHPGFSCAFLIESKICALIGSAALAKKEEGKR